MVAPQFGAFPWAEVAVAAAIAVLSAFAGAAIYERFRREPPRLGWRLLLQVGGLAAGVALVSLILELRDDNYGAMGAALLTLLLALAALYLAGGIQRVATEPFAAADKNAPPATVPKDGVVPKVLEHLDEFKETTEARKVALEPIVWWQGAAEGVKIIANTPLDAAQAQQAQPEVDYKWVATENTSYRDPEHKIPIEAGALVKPPKLADLHEFHNRTQTTGSGDAQEIRTTERVVYRDPKFEVPVEKGEVLDEWIRLLPELGDKQERVPFARSDFWYYPGATKRTVAAGAAVPDDERARRAAEGRSEDRKVATAPVTYHARVFEALDVVPATIAREHPTAQIDVLRGIHMRKLVVGDDGRWSTSKLQVFLWTLVVLFILLSLLYFSEILQEDLNGAAGTDADAKKNDVDVDFAELEIPAAYFILLGGPFAAAILAKTFTETKTEKGTLAKAQEESSAGPIQGLNEIISDDTGRVDLVDTQYFAFNLIALGYVIGAFVLALDSGFPEVPEALFGLTGAAALAYTTKKATDRSVPTITSVSPQRIRTGDLVDVWGQNLVLGAGSVPTVELDGRPVADVDVVKDPDARVATAGRGGADHLRFKVPALPGDDTVSLSVTPEGGRPTAPHALGVDRGAIDTVEPQPLRLGRDERLLIRGRGLAEAGETTNVLLAGAPLDPEGPGQGDLVIAAVPAGQRFETGPNVRLVVEAGGRSATRLIAVEQPDITDVAPSPIPLKTTDDITITGSALQTRSTAELHLGTVPLKIVSSTDTRIVARMQDPVGNYPTGDTAVALKLGQHTLATRPVTVAPPGGP